jgi:hypothetical protein
MNTDTLWAYVLLSRLLACQVSLIAWLLYRAVHAMLVVVYVLCRAAVSVLWWRNRTKTFAMGCRRCGTIVIFNRWYGYTDRQMHQLSCDFETSHPFTCSGVQITDETRMLLERRMQAAGFSIRDFQS